MDPNEIISRCKLLIDSPKFNDLRRSVEEHDFNSIFRYVDNNEFDDLRKAIVEKNLHSLFRILGREYDDFRKLLLEKNHFSCIRSLKKFTNSRLIDVFDLILKTPEMDSDCMSRSQIKSKQWLVNEVLKQNLNLGTVFLCAGWYGILATMIFESKISCDKIRNFDIDSSCKKISEKINQPWVEDNWKYKHCIDNIYNLNYDTHVYNVERSDGSMCQLTDSPNTVINTSCEHIENFQKWYNSIPDGKLIILQSNNYLEIKEHVNCVNNIDEFVKQTPMTNRLYQGKLDTPKYTRFMTFGYK